MRIAGVDAATVRTGIALLVDGKIKKYELIDLHKNKDSNTRIPIMQNKIIDMIAKWKPDVVCIEDSWQGRNADTDKKIAYIIGSVMAYCYGHNIKFKKMLPSEWRKKIGLAQGKKQREQLKQASIDFVKEQFNIDAGDDIADAVCISYAGYLDETEDEDLF